jgi:hypothetical protein
MTQTYVYNGKEVFKTGRTASSKGRGNKINTLLEILPVKFINVESFTDYDVADWVRELDLFVINSITQEKNDGTSENEQE